MTARDRAGLALLAACTLAGAGVLFTISTTNDLEPAGDPDPWTSCTADTITAYPTPPPCLED